MWKVVDDASLIEQEVNQYITASGALPNFDYKIECPVHTEHVKYADKIRALAYNPNEMVIIDLFVSYKISRGHTFVDSRNSALLNCHRTCYNNRFHTPVVLINMYVKLCTTLVLCR